ncbi:epoxyqueuosine reductase [Chloroflexota bacterium]
MSVWIEAAILVFCRGPENSLRDAAGERAWAEPLVGFSSGSDPLYQHYKTVVGADHWAPSEAFTLGFPGIKGDAVDFVVISWILPQTTATRADNRDEMLFPSERWARSRIFGEAFNDQLRRHLIDVLATRGIQAVAPVLLPEWRSFDSELFVFSSKWSERHAAYASGLGTFGLCDGLITTKGKAVRAGSVIACIPEQHSRPLPTPRPYSHHQEYCLFFDDGSCGDCMARCPVGAITAAGHDKQRCKQHLIETEAYVSTHFGFDGYGCGLCQTGVRCESRAPARNDHASIP